MMEIKPRWDRTAKGVERLAGAGRIEHRKGVLFYNGRHVIGRDTPISGGVYIGGHLREAITVDSDSPEVQRLYEIAGNKASVLGRGSELLAIYDTVAEEMPYDKQGVEEIIDKSRAWRDSEIPLDVFIKERKAICRQQALACAVLAELFKRDGRLRGNLSVDRNSLFNMAHVWARYTSFNGKVCILDVAGGYFGRLSRASEFEKRLYCREGEVV